MKILVRRIHLWLWLFSGCAVQQYPNGGPKDMIPPSVIGSSVQSGTTQFNEKEIEFEFSEYMDKNSVRNSLFISPSVKNNYDLKWDGRFVRLILKEELKADVTYVITIGSTATDRRGGNKLTHAYQLAISTGNEIDTLSIAGHVFDANTLSGMPGTTVLAYNLTQNPNPNPEKDPADYYTQSGADGSFLLGYLKSSNYRVYVIKETYKNELWDKDEPIAVGLTPSIKAQSKPDTSYSFYLSHSDYESPVISGVVAENSEMLKVTFNENLVKENSKPEFQIMNENESLKINDIIFSFITKNQVYLTTDSLRDGNYKMIQNGLSDESMNISKNDTFSFAVFTKDFKKKSRLISFPADTNQVLDPAEVIQILYPKKQSIDSVRFFQRGLKTSKWTKSHGIIFLPDKQYRHSVSKEKNWNEENNFRGMIFSEKDTFVVAFRTYSVTEKGGITGYLENGSEAVSTYVELMGAETKKTYRTKLKANKFQFENLPAGRYTLTAFQDKNENNKWDSGTPFPWLGSEMKFYTTDTIKVRARWTVEDVKLKQR